MRANIAIYSNGELRYWGFTHARPNFGISGDLLSENEAKPVVICCCGGGCYRLFHIVINLADVNW